MPHDTATAEALQRLLDDHALTPETRLYREARFSALARTDEPGVFRLDANVASVESVLDVYGQGYVVQAESVGAGLALAESARPGWQETVQLRAMRIEHAPGGGAPDPVVEVAVRLGDVLEQGGLIYPVESVTVERAYFCTLPAGAVSVRLA
jgi:hypothetical protein